MTTGDRVKLRGVLPKTVTWATIERDGSLVVELYDMSDDATRTFGNDVAFLVTVGADGKEAMLTKLGAEPPADAADRDGLLLQLVRERFLDYYDVKAWLENAAIPHEKTFDSWA